MRRFRIGWIALAATMLSCGGDEADDPLPPCMPEPCTPVSETLPYAPLLTVSYGVKELQFVWSQSVNAVCYRLYQDANGTGDWAQVGDDLTVTEYGHGIAVHLFDWANAKFRVEACNDYGCVSSNEVTFEGDSVGAIGSFMNYLTDAGDGFGDALAVSGDGRTIAVGAWGEDSDSPGINGDESEPGYEYTAGAVYVFVRSETGWTRQAYVKASNPSSPARFGTGVALSQDGNTMAVGAPRSDGWDGGVYIFTRSGTTWVQEGHKTSGTYRNRFGISVALSDDGNKLAVGATGWGEPEGWAVYLFSRSGTTWGEPEVVTPTVADTSINDEMPLSLSDDGTTLAVGADHADGSGAAYVFARTGDVWTQQAYLTASEADTDDYFGISVDLSGDGNRLAVGARYEDGSATGINGTPDDAASNAGAAYLFRRSGETWSPEAYVKPDNTTLGQEFGCSVSLSDDGTILAVGAVHEWTHAVGINGEPLSQGMNSGAVYLYLDSGTEWSQWAFVKPDDPRQLGEFGTVVDLSSDGTTLAVSTSDTYANKIYTY